MWGSGFHVSMGQGRCKTSHSEVYKVRVKLSSHIETYFLVAFQHVANSHEQGLSDQVNYSICKNAGRYAST